MSADGKMGKRVKLIDDCELLNIKHRNTYAAIGDSAILIPITEWLMAV